MQDIIAQAFVLLFCVTYVVGGLYFCFTKDEKERTKKTQ